MIIKTRIFALCEGNYNNLSELAQAMGISVSQIYRVREGKRNINQKFIAGAIKAFPNYKLDDLFYLVPDMPTVVNGIGTWYWGKRDIHTVRQGCEHCGKLGEFLSYDTRSYFVFIFIPIIPLGKKRIIEQCPSCRKHTAVRYRDFQRLRQHELPEAVEGEEIDPSEVKPLLVYVTTDRDNADQERFDDVALKNESFQLAAKFFEAVHAYGNSGGSEVANLYDSAGDDTLVGWPSWSKLSGDGFLNRVKFFEEVYAQADAGGEDVANLYDSSGDDLLEAQEKFQITIGNATNSQGGGNLIDALTTPLSVNKKFTIEVKTPIGAILNIERTTPPAIDSVLNFH